MRYFPIFLDLQGRPALVVGGGETAARKLRLLRKAGADATVVAPQAVAEIAALAETGEISWQPRAFRASDLDGIAAVHSATGRPEVDRAVSDAARIAGIPVNVVDDPEASSFIVPAIVDRDPIVIGISSGGAAPVLARRVRERIEALLPSRLGRLAAFAERFRSAVAATQPPAQRRGFWEAIFDGPIGRAVLEGDESGANEAMIGTINRSGGEDSAERRGVVHIVGAGPGDPDLLTVKALRLIQDADVILYDALVEDAILERARRDAERIFVGKTKGQHSLPQARINALLAEHAGAGRRVVRLKGGDPFVFGRGGEELLSLREEGIDVEVVPGVTAAAACAATAGVPLTHRGLAQAVTFVTGHSEDGGNGETGPDLDWTALADRRQTLAIYMGVSTAGKTAARLIEAGAETERPVAVIENGMRPEQRIIHTSLGALEETVRAEQVRGPAMLLVGEVAGLAAEQGQEGKTIDNPFKQAVAS